MKESEELQKVIDQLAKLFRKHHLSYNQTKYVIQEARKKAELKPGRSKKRGTVTRLSKDEKNRFLNSAYGIDAKTGLMMLTLYETAARVDEFVNLTPSDLYVSDLVIVIRKGKGDKRREVPINLSLARALQVHLMGRKEGYIFESNRNTKFTVRRIEQIVPLVAEEAGIQLRVTPHTLRHTRATLLAEMGMSKDYLQSFLGHESPETTEIYTHTAALNVKKEFTRVTEENE